MSLKDLEPLRSPRYAEVLARSQLEIVWGWSRGKVQAELHGLDGHQERCTQVGGPNDSSLLRQSMSKDIRGSLDSGPFSFSWSLSEQTFQGQATWTDRLARQYPQLSWFAIGFSRQYGMVNTDVAMLRIVNNTPVLEDRFSTGFSLPSLDVHQSFELLNYSWDGDRIEFSFRRDRVTDDEQDIAIYPKPISLSWALGKDLKGHVRKEEVKVDLFRGGLSQVSKRGEAEFQQGVDEYLDLQVTAIKRARHLLDWKVPHEPDFWSNRSWNASDPRVQQYRDQEHSRWAEQLEQELSDYPLAKVFRSVCNLLGQEEPFADFRFTLCRASYGASWFGGVFQCVLQVLFVVGGGVCIYNILAMSLLEACFGLLLGWYLIDVNSGIIHIVLDNPATLRWPALHGSAAGFQSHHDFPTDSLNFPYNHSFCLVNVGSGIFMFFIAMLTTRSVVSGYQHSHVRFASLFLMMKIIICPFMMEFHMWAHKDLDDVPLLARWAIQLNLALSEENHVGHHLSYKEDFAIINGWSHNLLNWFLRNWRDQNSEDWTTAMFLFQMFPAAMVVIPWLCSKIRLASKLKTA